MSRQVAAGERRPVPAIDPRIRARRIAVQRDEGRRRLHRVTVLGSVLGALALAVVLALSPVFDVDAIRVTGARHSGAATVIAASGVDRGDPLAVLDAGGAASGVGELAWVEDVVVRRSWLGTVHIEVDERSPVAGIIGADGRVALVDATGKVLDEVEADATDVVHISGATAPGPPGATIGADARTGLAVAMALPDDVAARVGRIIVGRDGELALELRLDDEGALADVRLGRATEVAGKASALATLVASVDLTDVVVIDLRVPSAPVLTRR